MTTTAAITTTITTTTIVYHNSDENDNDDNDKFNIDNENNSILLGRKYEIIIKWNVIKQILTTDTV